jgi:CRP-like cAMP-binding protein
MKADDIERQFSEGECLLERDTDVRELYVIRDGEVRLDPGERLLGAGDLFGEVSAITGRPSETRAVATSDGSLLALDLSLLQDLCLRNGEFALRLIHHLAGRIDESETADEAPSASFVAARVARAILVHSGPDEPHAPVAGRLKDLAAEAGLDLLSTYREIQALLEEKVVRLADDELQVLDRQALEAMASRS